MDNQKALRILINAVNLAVTKGAFNLQEAKIIAEAVEQFNKPPTSPELPEVKKDKKK